MAVNVKLGVDLGEFTSSIKTGQNLLKGLSAEMKAADAEFKATGNAEKQLADKTKTLNSQLQVQKGIADQAKQALKAMDEAGVKPTDAAYQKLYATMMNATAGMNEAQAALNGLGTSAQGAATGADQLTTSVQSIGKKISLDQVISGIDTIKSGLESAAKKAVDLGEKLWNTIMDSAKRADDTATMAEMYGIDLDTFMKMQKLVTGGMDTSVDAMLSAQDKLKKGIGKESKEVIGYLEELGVSAYEMYGSPKYGDQVMGKARDTLEVFWETGQALMAMGDAYDQEAAAQALFGKSWKELRPLFNTYKDLEEYNKARDAQTVNTEETIRDLAALNDAVSNLEGSWTTLKDEVLGALAPALQKGADAIAGLLDKLTKYMETPEGQKLLDDLGTAVSGLFDDLGKIDPDKVVEGVSGVLTKIKEAVEWVVNNKDTVVGALKGILIGWGALELTGGALKILELVQGIKGLTGAGAAAAGEAGAAAGASWAAGFSNAVATGFPILASMLGITMVALTPAMIAQAQAEQKWQTQYYERAAAAAIGGENAWFINQANETFGMKGQTQRDMAEALLMGLGDRQNQQRAELYNLLSGRFTSEAGNTWNALNAFWGGAEMDPSQINAMLQDITDAMAAADTKAQIPVEPAVQDDAAEVISQQIGTVPVNVTPVLYNVAGLSGILSGLPGFANGIQSVPYDGMLARLHKGERVVPAREVASRSFSSNLYVENMNMGGGVTADALAAAIAGRNRRMMAGYGS